VFSALCSRKSYDKYATSFLQSVPQAPVNAGFAHARAADVSIVLGSGMHTGPFCEMPPLA
jgi:hypothetical protein